MRTNTGVNSGYLIVPETYEDSASNEAIEKSISATLPHIPDLDTAASSAERCAVLSAAAAVSRSAFVARYGNAFGCEPVAAASEQGNNAGYVPAKSPQGTYASA